MSNASSGSGKPPLLNMMGGLEPPTPGSVIVRGDELAAGRHWNFPGRTTGRSRRLSPLPERVPWALLGDGRASVRLGSRQAERVFLDRADAGNGIVPM